jgi:rhodanese-related sulfurtransferase
MTAENAHEMLRTDPAVILICAYDSEEEFRKNDLEGAMSLSEFRQRIDTFPRDEHLIFYCACPHDEEAMRQAEEYQGQGFENVWVLEGGVHAWQSAGYHLVEAGM